MKSNDVMKITSRGLFRGSRKQPNKKKKQKKPSKGVGTWHLSHCVLQLYKSK